MSKLIRSVLAFVLMIGVPGLAAAQEMALPIETQWGLFENILSFDRSFDERAQDGLVVGILFQNRFRGAALAESELVEISRKNQLSLDGHRVRFVSIEITTPGEVERRLIEEGVDVVYLTPVRAAPISELVQVALRHGIVTLTGVPEYVSLGIGIGLGLRAGRPEILVNLESCRAQGMELSSDLLRIATIFAEAN